jgi:FMN phosphatase YigB (HAD superfamily)
VSGRVVLFDVMDTLVHDPFRHVMPAFFGMTLAEMMREKHPHAWVEFELAERDEASFLRDFFADGRAFDGEGFREAVFGGYRIIEGIEPILAELRARDVPMHAASNYPAWYRAVEARTKLSRYVAWSFVSCDLALRKPDPAYFQAVLGRLGVDASDCVFVDDQPRNCDAAAELGFDVIRFEGADALREGLARRALLAG